MVPSAGLSGLCYQPSSSGAGTMQRQQWHQHKSGERIAKVIARAGLGLAARGGSVDRGRACRRQRRGDHFAGAQRHRRSDNVTVDGEPLPARERTRLFLYHKPRGLMTTHADPQGRPTIFSSLPKDLPRLISVGRLDFNTEGLLLLTNDGALARVLELPATGWLRRYRVRAHGAVTQASSTHCAQGVTISRHPLRRDRGRASSACRARISGSLLPSARARTARCATCSAISASK